MNGKHEFVFVSNGVASLCAALVVSGVLFLPGKGMADDIYTMNDGGSSAILNVGNSGTLGMNNWSVAGQNQLIQQWFWYSINGSAPQPINTLGVASVTPNGANELTVTYQSSQLSVNVDYVLSGNGVGSGSADMTELIWIDNVSPQNSSPLSLSFYQYSNFNLLGNNNNTVSISGNSSDGYTGALQTTGGPGGTGIAELIVAPNANRAEAATVSQTLNELNNPANVNFNLNDITSASGDVSWAFQWDAPLSPGDELDITKDKGLAIHLVPEPSTVAFIALGLGAWGLARRRQSF